jgi:uncharacterized YigZ family protein
MKVPLGFAEYEYDEKKSRFIASVRGIENPQAAKEILRRIRQEHPGARHVVHAFVSGEQGEVQGSSDDGEPAGTAGRPVLELLKGRSLTQVLVTVVRYFGGVKLGTGGLVRAYTAAARGALDQLAVEQLIRRAAFELHLPYAHYEGFARLLTSLQGQIIKESFKEDVSLSARIPEDQLPALTRALAELTGGQCTLVFNSFDSRLSRSDKRMSSTS